MRWEAETGKSQGAPEPVGRAYSTVVRPLKQDGSQGPAAPEDVLGPPHMYLGIQAPILSLPPFLYILSVDIYETQNQPVI